MNNEVLGFSKMSKDEKIDWICQHYFDDPSVGKSILLQYWNSDAQLQKLHDEFIENTISNFYLPFAVAPNFLIDNSYVTVPMVIEESSVVAAASKSAKFWGARGGFKTTILGTEKLGQVHFLFKENKQALLQFWDLVQPKFYEDTQAITSNMQKRGGGIKSIELVDKTKDLEHYFQINVRFETIDSMGANFINSCLEQIAKTIKREARAFDGFAGLNEPIEIIMSILSNYVDNCVVRAVVSCAVEDLKDTDIPDPELFAQKMVTAVQIAKIEPYRAVTHNKGIMNGIDSVVLATGNDFRAVEAGVHAYASRGGVYSSLSDAKIDNGIFSFWLQVPLALGTVGGLTSLHPLVNVALNILNKPSAPQLMRVAASVGLAQNFAALRSLTTKGIQEGHMKMHLKNILNQHQATKQERDLVKKHFENKTISHASVSEFINQLRQTH